LGYSPLASSPQPTRILRDTPISEPSPATALSPTRPSDATPRPAANTPVSTQTSRTPAATGAAATATAPAPSATGETTPAAETTIHVLPEFGAGGDFPSLLGQLPVISAGAAAGLTQFAQVNASTFWSDFKVSTDGRYLVSEGVSGNDPNVVVWDLTTGRAVMKLEASGNRNGIALSPDGRTLATVNWDESVQLWDLTGRQALGKPISTPYSSPKVTWMGDFTADGKTLVFTERQADYGSPSDSNQIMVYFLDIASGHLASKPAPWPRGSAKPGENIVVLSGPGPTQFLFVGESGGGEDYVWDGAQNGYYLVGLDNDNYTGIRAAVLPGRLLAVASLEGPIKLYDMGQQTTLSPRRVVLMNGTLQGLRLAISPDGALIAESANDGQVRVWNVETGQLLKTISVDQYIEAIAFSPDGRYFATGSSDGIIRFWGLKGSAASPTTTGPATPPQTATVRAAATPFGGTHGRWIAFVSARDGRRQLYLMQVDGTSVTRLTDDHGNDNSPSWAPDGARLAFVSDRDGNSEVYALGADGTGLINLTNNSADDQTPTWSPDGQHIAFASNRGGNYDIYVMNADGSNPTRLTNGGGDNEFPAWSPDGQWLAFQSNQERYWTPYAIRADGSQEIRLVKPQTGGFTPVWSPDGLEIAFMSFKDGPSKLYKLNFASALKGDAPIDRLYNQSLDDQSPSWSPDGQQVTFSSKRTGDYEVYTLNLADQSLQRLTRSPGNDTSPTWQP
jgi:Tol biopolymer transport system component